MCIIEDDTWDEFKLKKRTYFVCLDCFSVEVTNFIKLKHTYLDDMDLLAIKNSKSPKHLVDTLCKKNHS